MIDVNTRWRRAAALLVLPLALAACDRFSSQDEGEVERNWTPRNPNEVLGVPNAALRTAVEQRLKGKPPARIDADEWKHVKSLYERFGGAPLWLASDGLDKMRTKALADAILKSASDGMRMDAYPIAEMAQAIAAVREDSRPTAEQLAETDVILTASFAALGEDLLSGQVDPKTVAQSWHIDPGEEAIDSALARSIRLPELDDAIAEMRPTDPDYDRLRQELERFRKIAAAGGWPVVAAGKAVKPGVADDASRLAALRARLAAEGLMGGDSAAPSAAPAPAAGGRAVYDPQLAGAVARFQERHGIQVDSMLGPQTLASLNIPAQARLGQIAANLERYRWLPRYMGQRYIFVNVPAFRVEAYKDGKKELEMKVIVGAEYDDRSTPVFADKMEFVVFRPYWNVTPDIQANELGPKFASNPGAMAAGNYEYWNDGGTRRIRQRPGASNSLGLVKFMFPNDFNIYLHDTPHDELFRKDVRALSHGCIRLEKPEEMAQWVLGWDAEKVRAAMHADRDDRRVNLPQKIPVYIAYFTTYIRDGQLYFGNDVYDRDGLLVKAMSAGAMPSEQTVQAVQALRRIADTI